MGDVEDETFETQDSGAAHAYPIEAGQIRKGGFIMIKVPHPAARRAGDDAHHAAQRAAATQRAATGRRASSSRRRRRRCLCVAGPPLQGL